MITMQIKGIHGTIGRIQRLEKNIQGAKKDMLHEFGMKAKQYAKENITSARAIFSGKLLKSIHFRTTPDYVNVWSDAKLYDTSWEFGMTPHFIHRNMTSAAGYKVGKWMDAHGMQNRNYVLVGAGTPIGAGIHFMENAYIRLRSEARSIVDKYERMIAK